MSTWKANTIFTNSIPGGSSTAATSKIEHSDVNYYDKVLYLGCCSSSLSVSENSQSMYNIDARSTEKLDQKWNKFNNIIGNVQQNLQQSSGKRVRKFYEHASSQ